MITHELKERVIKAMIERRESFAGSDAKFATALGISPTAYNRIKNGNTDQVLSDQNWISLARKLDTPLREQREWKAAVTPTFEFISAQLAFCQQNGASRILCDVPDIGKTFTAKVYCRANKNAVYIDCSQVKSKQRLVRQIAQEFGVNHRGRYAEVYADLVFYLRSLEAPLIVLDEAGDLEYQAFLELKALWNATEKMTGWYMMGADGLKAKMKRSIANDKVGYAELFSRFGARYQKASPDTANELKQFKTVHAAIILQANAPGQTGIEKMIRQSDYSLRRIYDEINKVS